MELTEKSKNVNYTFGSSKSSSSLLDIGNVERRTQRATDTKCCTMLFSSQFKPRWRFLLQGRSTLFARAISIFSCSKKRKNSENHRSELIISLFTFYCMICKWKGPYNLAKKNYKKRFMLSNIWEIIQMKTKTLDWLKNWNIMLGYFFFLKIQHRVDKIGHLLIYIFIYLFIL